MSNHEKSPTRVHVTSKFYSKKLLLSEFLNNWRVYTFSDKSSGFGISGLFVRMYGPK